jgi:hypothetical protein
MELRRRRVAGLLVGAAGFGISMSIVKGNGAGLRDTIGNVSAPWLLLPFAAGVLTGHARAVAGALAGLAVSMAAMVGFYVTDAVVLDLGPHLWLVDLRLAVEGGRMYLALAVFSGPVFGALGASWQRRHSVVLGFAVASLLVFEPIAWLLYQRGQDSILTSYPAVWSVEVALGILGCWYAYVCARRNNRSVQSIRSIY